jgi:hypothetical protein
VLKLLSSLQYFDMHILKIKGKAKIPDYIQIRDDDFTLKAYFRVDRPEKSLEKIGLGGRMEELLKLIEEMPFGKVIKIA